MRQHWKRVLALLLCFAMVFGTNFSMNCKAVFADEDDTTIGAVNEEAAGNENDVNEETVSSEDAVPEETVSSEGAAPGDTVSEEGTPKETVSEEGIPEETVSEEGIPEETVSEDGSPAEESTGNGDLEFEEPTIDFDVSGISMNGAYISLGFDDEQFTVSMAAVDSENGPDEEYDGWIKDVSSNKAVSVNDLLPDKIYYVYASVSKNGEPERYDPCRVGLFSTVKEYRLVFENDELSVPLRSTTEFGKYTGDPELEIVVSEDHIFKKDDDGFEKFAVSRIDAADSTYSLNYKDESMPGSIIFESIRKNQTLFASLKEHEPEYSAFRELYEENCKVTLSANLDISSADASKDATAETEVEITLTNLDVIVSANELTLRSTRLGEYDTLGLFFKADHVDGLDEFEKWDITSQNSVCGAFGTTLNSSSTVSANVEFNTGNGKIYIKDVKPLMESGEDWCNVFRKYVTPGVTFVPEGKDRGADMTVVNEDEELTVTQAGTTVLYDDYDYWDDTNKSKFKDSFTVKIGNTDILGSDLCEQVIFKYAVDDSKAWTPEFPENLHAGQKISISVNYWTKEEKLKTPKSGPIIFQIAKQPVVVRLKKPEKFTPTESEKSPAKVYGSRNMRTFGSDVVVDVYRKYNREIKGDTAKALIRVDQWFKPGASLSVDTAASKLENINISIPASYTVYFNVSDNDLKEGNVSMNYTLAALPEADLVIGQSAEVGFYSAKTGKSISDNILVAADKEGLNGIRITVSSATAPKEFKYFDVYFDNSDDKSTTLLKENGFTDVFVPGKGWVYTFDLADAYEKFEGKESIRLYASDTEYVDEFSGNAKIISTGGVTVSVSSIRPVVYDGNKIFAADDPKAYNKDGSVKKNISPKLNVRIINFDSGAVLVPGTDYTLSYKNNVNAVTSKTTDKKRPTVVITGKGNYKGIKVSVPFMILPADMSEYAKIKAGSSKYVKYGKRGFDAKLTVVALGTKKKLNKKTYDLIYYTADGKVTDASKYTKETTEAAEFYVTVRAKDDQNYTGETVFDEDGHVWGIPTSSKKLKIKSTNKGDFAENRKYEEFFKVNSITATDKDKTVIPVGDKNKAGIWYEDTAGERVKGQKIIEEAGTHYLYVGPDYDNVEGLEPEQLESQLKYMFSMRIFEPTKVKLNCKGEKMAGAKINGKASLKLGFSEEDQILDVSLTSSKVTNKKWVTVDDLEILGKNIHTGKTLEDSDKIVIPGYTPPGKYYIYLTGIKGYTGSQKLIVTISTRKLKAADVKIAVNHPDNSGSLPFNRAGCDYKLKECISVKLADKSNIELQLGKDYTFTSTKPSKTGTDAGRFTVNFYGNYTGSAKGNFNVGSADLAKDAYVLGVSMLAGNKMVPKAIVVQDEWKSSWKKQSDGTYVDNGNFYEAALKEGKDYSLENVKKYDKDGKEVQDDKDTYYMTADVTAKNTDLFKGKVPVKVDVYGKEIKTVKITRISDNKATSTNAITDSSGKHYVLFRGTQDNSGENMSVCPRVVEIVIVYKDGSQSDPIRPKDLNGDLADDPRFFIDAADIGNITNKAEIVFRFKDGTMGPTDKTYTARYNIVGQDKFPK